MNDKTIIIYASVDGQTLKICNSLKDQLQEKGQDIELLSIDEFDKDLNNYDKVIIGSSVRYGLHNKNIIAFINAHKTELNAVKTALQNGYRSIDTAAIYQNEKETKIRVS